MNSKYIHSALAPWYLKASCGEGYGEIKVREFTINDSLDAILAAVFREKADIAAFSCYIWNIPYVLRLAEGLKKISPGTKTVLGGPEVSFDAEATLKDHEYIDYILSGEGEQSFKLLLEHIYQGSDIKGVGGLTYRKDRQVISNKACVSLPVLDSIPSPYTAEMLDGLKNKIVYFESSRGCPFSCAYCLSSTSDGVRFFSMERVKNELTTLINAGVRQIKFVDRTFNCHKARAKEIFEFIIEKARRDSLPNFHFEAAADLFDDEMLDILSRVPPGLIQFEIGIQTTNPETLEAIHRKTDLHRVFHHVIRLRALDNIHLHLDLIAGLPFEDYASFARSFNEVYALKPHQLQMGFLKMLKGSKLRAEAERYQYKFRSYPPYEFLENADISFEEMLELKRIEEVLERYYNSGKFQESLDYIIGNLFPSPFEFYREVYNFSMDKGYLDRPMASRELYNALLDFVMLRLKAVNAGTEAAGLISELLKLDYLSTDNTNNLPDRLERVTITHFKDLCFEFLKNEAHIEQYLPECRGIPAKQIIKKVHFEVFNRNVFDRGQANAASGDRIVVLFDYTQRDKITGIYKYFKVPMLN